jgi:fatty-acyl-CoA synthase
LVNINPAYRLTELEYALNKVSCRALVLWDEFKTSNYLEMIGTLAPETSHCEPGQLKAKRLPYLDTLIQITEQARPGFYKFDDICSLANNSDIENTLEAQSSFQPDDPINIQFTKRNHHRLNQRQLSNPKLCLDKQPIHLCPTFKFPKRAPRPSVRH